MHGPWRFFEGAKRFETQTDCLELRGTTTRYWIRKILKIPRRSYVPGSRIAEQRKRRSLHLGRQSLKHSHSVAPNIDCRIGIGCRNFGLLWSRERCQNFNLCSMNPSHGKWGKRRRTIRWYSPPAHDRVGPSSQIVFPDLHNSINLEANNGLDTPKPKAPSNKHVKFLQLNTAWQERVSYKRQKQQWTKR